MTRPGQERDLFSRIWRQAASDALALAVLFVLAVVATTVTQAQSFKVLYQFKGGRDGVQPFGGVIVDASGNLYGTTTNGGSTGCSGYGCGTVFRISNTGKETVLYRFKGGKDGALPTRRLLRDSQGNLYGTTIEGGIAQNCGGSNPGCGTVFKISKTGKETVLYRFTQIANFGNGPSSPLLQDAAGNLYGTASGEGTKRNDGMVFKLDKAGKLTKLYGFAGQTAGVLPAGNLVLDANGNIYGTTVQGGDMNQKNPCGAQLPPSYGCGVLYKVDSAGKETVLHAFTGGDFTRTGGTDGAFPLGGVISDSQGNLYGTTTQGGDFNQNSCTSGGDGCGTVFKITSAGEYTVLYRFTGPPADGDDPSANVAIDSAGKLYGESQFGGAASAGALFKIDDTGKGEQLIYSFSGSSDGAYPLGGVFLGHDGTVYGTAPVGGDLNSCGGQGCGTVFEIVP